MHLLARVTWPARLHIRQPFDQHARVKTSEPGLICGGNQTTTRARTVRASLGRRRQPGLAALPGLRHGAQRRAHRLRSTRTAAAAARREHAAAVTKQVAAAAELVGSLSAAHMARNMSDGFPLPPLSPPSRKDISGTRWGGREGAAQVRLAGGWVKFGQRHVVRVVETKRKVASPPRVRFGPDICTSLFGPIASWMAIAVLAAGQAAPGLQEAAIPGRLAAKTWYSSAQQLA